MRPGAAAGPGNASGLWLEWDRAGVRSRLPLHRTLTIGREAGCDVRIPAQTCTDHRRSPEHRYHTRYSVVLRFVPREVEGLQ